MTLVGKKKLIQFDFNTDIDQQNQCVKHIKANKTKFIRDLNYKSNVQIKSERNNKLLSNSKEKDYIIKKQRTRKNSSCQFNSLLEKAIPGARILKGQWKDNKLNGDVQIQYENGNRFQGKYQNGVRISGKMFYAEGNCQYEGSFFSEKFSGYGKLSYMQGRIIEGQWDDMEFVGNATITYPNKDVYYGPVDDQLYKHGEGYLFLNNGLKYVGSFKHGSITGIGCYYKDEILIKKGIWNKGKLVKQLVDEQESDLFDLKNNPVGSTQSVPVKQNFRYKFKIDQNFSYKPHNQKTQESQVQLSQSLSTLVRKQRTIQLQKL